MPSEIQAVVLCFDLACTIRHMLEERLYLEFTRHAFLDSNTVKDIIGKDGQTS